MTTFDGKEYQARFDALAASGRDLHGEATLVRSFEPRTVLDAGCGTGRVAIELARHGIEVIGVDVSASMIAEAQRLAPSLSFLVADLATLELDRTFDVVVLAGNVPLFCPEEHRSELVRRCAAHVAIGGVLVSGFQLDQGYGTEHFDRAAFEGGLELAERFSTWDREPLEPSATYAVSVHRRLRSAER